MGLNPMKNLNVIMNLNLKYDKFTNHKRILFSLGKEKSEKGIEKKSKKKKSLKNNKKKTNMRCLINGIVTNYDCYSKKSLDEALVDYRSELFDYLGSGDTIEQGNGTKFQEEGVCHFFRMTENHPNKHTKKRVDISLSW